MVAEAALEAARHRHRLAQADWDETRQVGRPAQRRRVAPDCSCEAGCICQLQPCRYYLRLVPDTMPKPSGQQGPHPANTVAASRTADMAPVAQDGVERRAMLRRNLQGIISRRLPKQCGLAVLTTIAKT